MMSAHKRGASEEQDWIDVDDFNAPKTSWM
jgi:hypothetical protein